MSDRINIAEPFSKPAEEPVSFLTYRIKMIRSRSMATYKGEDIPQSASEGGPVAPKRWLRSKAIFCIGRLDSISSYFQW